MPVAVEPAGDMCHSEVTKHNKIPRIQESCAGEIQLQ